MPAARKHVFISHSASDDALGRRVVAALEAAGIKCWYSSRSADLEPGVEWDSNIVGALDDSFAVVLLFTSASNGSKWVRRELHMAGERNLPIYPVRLEQIKPSGGMEPHLISVQWVNAFSKPVEKHLAPLVKTLRALNKNDTARNKPKLLPSWTAAASNSSPPSRQRKIGIVIIVGLGIAAIFSTVAAFKIATRTIDDVRNWWSPAALKLIEARFQTGWELKEGAVLEITFHKTGALPLPQCNLFGSSDQALTIPFSIAGGEVDISERMRIWGPGSWGWTIRVVCGVVESNRLDVKRL